MLAEKSSVQISAVSLSSRAVIAPAARNVETFSGDSISFARDSMSFLNVSTCLCLVSAGGRLRRSRSRRLRAAPGVRSPPSRLPCNQASARERPATAHMMPPHDTIGSCLPCRASRSLQSEDKSRFRPISAKSWGLRKAAVCSGRNRETRRSGWSFFPLRNRAARWPCADSPGASAPPAGLRSG